MIGDIPQCPHCGIYLYPSDSGQHLCPAILTKGSPSIRQGDGMCAGCGRWIDGASFTDYTTFGQDGPYCEECNAKRHPMVTFTTFASSDPAIADLLRRVAELEARVKELLAEKDAGTSADKTGGA